MAPVEAPEESQQDVVESWRLHCLIEAGYPVRMAKRLAESGCDLHVACEILAKGCNLSLAVRIMR